MSPNPPDPESSRSRMVRGAGQLIRERGIHGVGMRQVVDFSRTPRGSLQRYFPGGKAQLTAEAVLLSRSRKDLVPVDAVQALFGSLTATAG